MPWFNFIGTLSSDMWSLMRLKIVLCIFSKIARHVTQTVSAPCLCSIQLFNNFFWTVMVLFFIFTKIFFLTKWLIVENNNVMCWRIYTRMKKGILMEISSIRSHWSKPNKLGWPSPRDNRIMERKITNYIQ